MNHAEQFKRSINIWKVSDMDKEAMNIYVDMYLYMTELFKNLKEFKLDEYPQSIYYINSDNNILIEVDLQNYTNWISYNYVYILFENKYGTINKYDILEIIHGYLNDTLYLKGLSTFHTPQNSFSSWVTTQNIYIIHA